MYGFHPDTAHEAATVEAAQLRRAASRRRARRVSLRTRHVLGTIFVRP
jgi:hypothetical protein